MRFTTPVVNLIAGPCTRKSTTMGDIFVDLKRAGYNAEMVPEWFKPEIYNGTFGAIAGDQLYITARQNHEMFKLMDSDVDVVITDHVLLNGIFYGSEEHDSYKVYLVYKFMEYNNLNVFLERPEEYEESGRNQTRSEAVEIDGHLRNIFDFLNIPYIVMPQHDDTSGTIAAIAADMIRNKRL